MDTETRRLLERQAEPGWATLFWDVFERSLSPIVLVDESRRVLATNSAAADLLGYRARDLVGRPIDELITKPTRAQREKEWRRLLKTGEQSGAYTYVRRDGSQLEVDFAVRLVRVGEQELGVAVAFPLGRVTFARQAGDQAAPLTAREREVVALIALGQETNRIAENLFISPQTVRTHVQHAMAKLGVHTRAELVAVAFSRGELLQPSPGKDLTGP